jgi:hypothetical protein
MNLQWLSLTFAYPLLHALPFPYFACKYVYVMNPGLKRGLP